MVRNSAQTTAFVAQRFGKRVRNMNQSCLIVAQSLPSALRNGSGIHYFTAHRAGTLKGASGKQQVSAEQMEISRLRAELARVTMERDILGKATAFFAKGQK
jgi:transposase